MLFLKQGSEFALLISNRTLFHSFAADTEKVPPPPCLSYCCVTRCTAVADETHEMEMADVIQYIHDSIKCGSKYIMYLL